MGMRKKTLNFLNRMTKKGYNHFSIKQLKVYLIDLGDIGRGEAKAYIKYLIDSGLIKNTNGEIYELNNDKRLDLLEEEEHAKNPHNNKP